MCVYLYDSISCIDYYVYLQVFDVVPPVDVLQTVAQHYVDSLVAEASSSHEDAANINNADITRLVASVFWEYLFDEPPEHVDLIIAAANDWRSKCCCCVGLMLCVCLVFGVDQEVCVCVYVYVCVYVCICVCVCVCL